MSRSTPKKTASNNNQDVYQDSFVPAFAFTNQDFPVTNHTRSVSKENLVWIRGITANGTPFEAEIWNNRDITGIAVLIPIADIESKETHYHGIPDIPCFHTEVESYDGGVLHIGMVEEGIENELSVVQQYTDILKKYSMIEFPTDMENGFVEYVSDAAGNGFARIVVTLEENNETMAITNLLFTPFPANEKRRGLRCL